MRALEGALLLVRYQPESELPRHVGYSRHVGLTQVMRPATDPWSFTTPEGTLKNMTEFEAAIDSLGIWSVNNLPGVDFVRLTADESDRTVDMEIRLTHDTWDAREEVIERMIDVRVMYMSDFAIAYKFIAIDGEQPMTQAGTRALEFAA